jgi:superfamily I DNA/RNA helicase
MSNFIPSPYQAAVFDFIENGSGSAIIQAVAGSGKTTTIVEALKRIPPGSRTLFLAFNKSIATELQSRVPSGVIAATFHSTAFKSWTRFAGRVKVEQNKVRDIMRDNCGDDLCIKYLPFCVRLVGYAKNAGIGFLVPDTVEEWWKLVDHFCLSLDTEEGTIEEAIDICQFLLERSTVYGKQVVDFDDMLYLPLVNSLTFEEFDFVFVDEAQDTNGVQQALLKRMVKRNTGRLIAVGDSAQAIYGFRGADSEAMARISREFACASLPLTVSYRCPRAVVEAAKPYCPHIEPHDSAPAGEVLDLPDYTPAMFENGSAILCRNTAPLISFAYALLGRNVPVRVLGREIGAGLVALIGKLKPKGIDGLIDKLAAYRAREVAKLTSQGKDAQAQAVEDKVDCVLIFIGQLTELERTVPALCRRIESLFSDTGDGKNLVTLATVHKSKGLEWPTVFVLDREKYMPSKYARLPWQQEQEGNLIYVAFTRAKSRLCFISSEAWQQEGGAK